MELEKSLKRSIEEESVKGSNILFLELLAGAFAGIILAAILKQRFPQEVIQKIGALILLLPAIPLLYNIMKYQANFLKADVLSPRMDRKRQNGVKRYLPFLFLSMVFFSSMLPSPIASVLGIMIGLMCGLIMLSNRIRPQAFANSRQ